MAINNLRNMMNHYIMTVDFNTLDINHPFSNVAYEQSESPLRVMIKMNDEGFVLSKDNYDYDSLKLRYDNIKHIDLSAYYRLVKSRTADVFKAYYLYIKIDTKDHIHFEFESRDYHNLKDLLIACDLHDVEIDDHHSGLLDLLYKDERIEKYLIENWSVIAKAQGLVTLNEKYTIKNLDNYYI